MKPEDTGVDPYDNNSLEKVLDILEADLPPQTDEEVQRIREALDEHRKGNDQRKAA